MTRFAIGQPVTQVEAPRLLTGKGRYTDDVTLARQSYAVFLRSPHAHADIVRIEAAAAREAAGVLAVLTGEDYAQEGLGEVTGASPLKKRDGSPMFRPPRPAIRRERVRHVGQIVAMVVAESINQAKDAAELIDVEYGVLQAAVDTETANLPGTPALWEQCPDNEPFWNEMGDRAATDAALAAAPRVIREKFTVGRITANAMEPRAVVAEYDDGRGHYTVYACQQRPFVWRTMMTKHLFRIPETDMTVIAGDVGGSFGMKGSLYCEVPLVAWASRRVGRPVKWTCERSEGHLADDQGRDMMIDFALGVDDQGRFLAARLSSKNSIGAYLTMLGVSSTNGIGRNVVGMYKTPAVHGEAAAVLSNTVPVGNYRAPGSPGAYALERMVDIAARELKIDPAELRRRNLIPAAAMPYKSKVIGYDCGEFEAVMDKCLKLADYAGFSARKAESAARGALRGLGLSSTVDPSAGPGPETAEIRFDPGGGVRVVVGSSAGGQSHATIYTQIVSDKLGVDAEKIRVIEGETDKLAWGTGTGGARTATIAGSAVLTAAGKIIEKARRIAAHMLEAAETDLELKDGKFTVAGTDKAVGFSQVAQAAFDPGKLPKDMELGLAEIATWNAVVSNIPYSCHVCEVEIDPETGVTQIVRYTAVHDAGVELNPLLVDGQIHGGIAQAAGEVLMEQVIYDRDSGQILTGSFTDYAMPRAHDFCYFDVDRHPVPTKTNPLGVKGVGEVGTVSALAGVMNAIHDALSPYGVRNLPMPATPERIWRAIQDSRAA